jgi:putative flippase GtrA
MSTALESLMPDCTPEPDGTSVGGQLLGFLLVGGSGAVAFIVLSSVAIDLHTGFPTWVASTLCYALLIGPVYLAHRRFSFQSEAPHGQALPRYVGVQVCSLLLASCFSYVLYGVFAMPTVFASVLVTGLTSAVNFVVLRVWAFAHHEPARIAAKVTAPADISG